MNPSASLTRRIGRVAVICSIVAGSIAALPTATSATSIAAAHAPGATIHVALGQHLADSEVAMAHSAGLMGGTQLAGSAASLGARSR